MSPFSWLDFGGKIRPPTLLSNEMIRTVHTLLLQWSLQVAVQEWRHILAGYSHTTPSIDNFDEALRYCFIQVADKGA